MTNGPRRFLAYEMFALPADLGGRLPSEMTPRQAQRYFAWFIEHIPDRLAELRNIVDGDLDLSPESLARVGEWFCSTMAWRRRTPDELRREAAGWSKRSRDLGLPVEDLTLTEESFSICIDVGIYLGEVHRRHFPDARWALCTKPKSDISYNQPRLEGLNPVPVDPINLTVSNGFEVARGRARPSMFVEAYQWLAARNRAT
jgi:hypothetical protein